MKLIKLNKNYFTLNKGGVKTNKKVKKSTCQ